VKTPVRVKSQPVFGWSGQDSKILVDEVAQIKHQTTAQNYLYVSESRVLEVNSRFR
jgi:hypothetical protein